VPDHTYTYGMLGAYELNRIDLLKDVFLWAYERSAARYAAIRQTTGDPDPFRLRHRQALKQIVSDVIREPMNPKDATAHIASWAAKHIDDGDRARFIESRWEFCALPYPPQRIPAMAEDVEGKSMSLGADRPAMSCLKPDLAMKQCVRHQGDHHGRQSKNQNQT
jgi:hypothetical protein